MQSAWSAGTLTKPSVPSGTVLTALASLPQRPRGREQPLHIWATRTVSPMETSVAEPKIRPGSCGADTSWPTEPLATFQKCD